jgi:hypothetical protein
MIRVDADLMIFNFTGNVAPLFGTDFDASIIRLKQHRATFPVKSLSPPQEASRS